MQGKLTESEAREQYYVWCINAGTKDEKGLRNRRKKEAEVFFGSPKPLNPPTVKTSSKSYTPGTNIEITWNTISNATGYWIDIYRDGEHIISSNIGNVKSYTLKSAVKGEYGIFVTAFKDDGNWESACSECYNFQVKELNAPTVYTKAKYYVPDAEVDIKWNLVDGATGYWIDIWRDGEHILSQSLNNANTSSYTYKCSKGKYGIFVTAYSENGGWTAACSNCYNFYVRDIEAPVPTTNSKYYTPKSNVEINWNKIDDATGYWIDIWKDGEHTYSKNIDNVTSYTISNTEVGTYEVYVAAFNSNGGWSASHNEAIKFYVKESPSKPALDVHTNGSSVILKWNKCTNTDFYGVRINNFEDDSSYVYKEPYEGNEFTIKLPPGKYFANIASVQKNGFYTFSDDIYFEIEDSKIEGDVNNDDKLNVSDAVLLQKWLLGMSNTELANWKAADLCEDGRLDVFDMVEMRKLLIQNK
ncbi:MAG: hypothetical protein K2J40_09460 [Ruminococcus sp.]|nr:hypothetical protein [Ruminococcus sp.]